MSAAIIIPARYGSTRFPGKPLALVAGVTMLERVWRVAKAVEGATRVVIATDDQRLCDHAHSFGAEAVMTPESCDNGTERTHAAVLAAAIKEDIIVNLQGDAPLTPPWVLEAMIAEMAADPSVQMATPVVQQSAAMIEKMRANKQTNPGSGTTAVFDKDRNALYFSKLILPYMRKSGVAEVYRHVGLYAFRQAGLAHYITLPPTPLEQAEGLEQLRALENGMSIRCVVVDYRGRTHASIDAPDDVPIVEAIIADEGELVGAA